MWDDPRPGARRGMRDGDPAASRRGPTWQTGRPAGPPAGRPAPDYTQNPYRPYGEQSAPRVPAYRLPPGMPADPSMSSGWTDAELQTVHHHRMGVAIFHDGNPGHLWRGELASRLGEATLAAGMLMWLYDLIGTPLALALAVVTFGVPFLIAPLLVAGFENSPEPGIPLKWIGRLRFVFALGLIAMHYHTILPAVYGLLFIISLCGRLREGARVAAMRTCLAPSEPEHVANDTHVGAAVAAVVGPLLATLFYVVTGERILGVSIGAAVLFLISFNSESFLDALPPARRAFLLATPESVAVDDASLDSLSQDDEDLDDDERRELKLPEWYQQGPSSAWEAVSDIRIGLGLAGSTPVSSAALWALGALALVGGGLSVLEVFYITSIVSLPAFYLGPLLAAEGAGMALGVSLAGGLPGISAPRTGIVIGLVSTGAALALLVLIPEPPIVMLAALGLGLANALGVSAARHALTLGFDGVERRALASGEEWITALCGVAGALLFTLFFTGPEGVPIHLPSRLLPSWPLPVLLLLTAVGLAAAGPLLAIASPPSGRRRAKKAKPGASGSRVPAPHDDEDLDTGPGTADDSAYLPATGVHAAWDGEAGDDGGDWDESYSEQYPAQRTSYGQAYDTGGYDAYDDDDDPRHAPPARRPPSRRNRPRW